MNAARKQFRKQFGKNWKQFKSALWKEFLIFALL